MTYKRSTDLRRSLSLSRLVPLCIAFIIFFSAPISAQNFRNAITGFVFTSERVPVPQIYVELLNELNQLVQRTKTDASGRYSFAGLSPGRFFVKVLPHGTNFEEQTVEVELINLLRPGGSSSDIAYKDIFLRPRKSQRTPLGEPGTVYSQDVPAEAKSLYEKGMRDIESDRREQGVQQLMEAVKIFPEYFAALERLGYEFIRLERFNYAYAAFTKAVSVNDRSFACWYGLGLAASALDSNNIAIEAANKALSIDRGSSNANLLLGVSQRKIKKYAEAEQSLLRAKKLSDGNSADVRWNLALLYGNDLKKYSEAADELEAYLKLTPNHPRAEQIKKLIREYRQKS